MRNSGIVKSKFECKRDNLTIRGTEYRPQGDNLPIAIVCHGFMAFQDTVRHYAEALAGMGYASYCFDFCGGCVVKGKSDGKTTDMSVLTEVADLEAVIAYTSSLPYTDSDSILLMGCSQGGFVSALTAAKPDSAISNLILFYPALCIPDDARVGKMMFARFDPANVPEQFRCGPMKLGSRYVTDVIHMDPYQEIGGYSGNVLIVHGTADPIVRADYSERARDTYRNRTAGDPNRPPCTELCTIEGGKHGFSRKHDALAVAAVRKFLRKQSSCFPH